MSQSTNSTLVSSVQRWRVACRTATLAAANFVLSCRLNDVDGALQTDQTAPAQIVRAPVRQTRARGRKILLTGLFDLLDILAQTLTSRRRLDRSLTTTRRGPALLK
jgi:hypothetical protein